MFASMHESNPFNLNSNLVQQVSTLASAAVGQTLQRPLQLYIWTSVNGPILGYRLSLTAGESTSFQAQ